MTPCVWVFHVRVEVHIMNNGEYISAMRTSSNGNIFRITGLFVMGIHRSPVNSPHKGQWRRALMLSLICALNRRLYKQSWDWLFETPSCTLWRQCNDGDPNMIQSSQRHKVRVYGYYTRGVGERQSYTISGVFATVCWCIYANIIRAWSSLWFRQHYNDVIMGAIDGVSHRRRLHCLLSCWLRRRSKKASKLRNSGLCLGNSPVTGKFPAQKASNAENIPFHDVIMCMPNNFNPK